MVYLIMSFTRLCWRRLLSVDLLIADNSCKYLQLCICILQQSQLSHYPDRKIDEFRQRIEELETEYKRFLKKLCSLEPTCKHKPWEPRAYAKRRQDPVTLAKRKRMLMRTSTQRKQETAYHTYLTYLIDIQELHTPSVPATTQAYDPLNQDLPLCFEQSRLAVALASSCVALTAAKKQLAASQYEEI
uniref:Uncharacterized protein n=1 Tax=Cyprinus carpio TaxID=7962 RepID=A0A8C2H1F4_CYPCA